MAISAKSAQEFVPIREIQNDTVIMKDGSLRALIICSSINFALKSEDEKTAVLGQFQNFLNSLDFSIQISMQSRRLDIKPYIELLAQKEDVQTNDLMKVQLHEYMNFIKELTTKINIMEKSFFVVVPYIPASLSIKKGGMLSFGKKETFTEKNVSFVEHKSQLDERVSFVTQGIQGTGVKAQRLDTEALIELYYTTFNPGDTQKPAKTT